MKFIVAVFLCLMSAVGFAAQTEKTDYAGAEKEKTKPSLTLAKEDSEGNIIEGVKSFAPKDIPLITEGTGITVGLDKPWYSVLYRKRLSAFRTCQHSLCLVCGRFGQGEPALAFRTGDYLQQFLVHFLFAPEPFYP